MKVLGLAFDYHDSAAALLVDGKIIAAAQEERFSRRKNDAAFPVHAIDYCLREGGLTAADLDAVVHYENPVVKFDRILSGCAQAGDDDDAYLRATLRGWLREGKFDVRGRIARHLAIPQSRVHVVAHHDSHLASAFLPSPFEEAAILTMDGVGEYETATIAHGRGTTIERLAAIEFPHSIGLFYSALTAFLGFEVNEGEYKVMGMAAFGQPRHYDAFVRLFDLHDDGTFTLDQSFFNFLTPRDTPFTDKLLDMLGPPRAPESPFSVATRNRPAASHDPAVLERSAHYADIAASVQKVTEDVILHMASAAMRRTGSTNLCLAGGVALNSLANGRIRRELGASMYIQPAAGDAGGAIGAAAAYHATAGGARMEPLRSAYLGPAQDDAAVEAALAEVAAQCSVVRLADDDALCDHVAGALAEGQVVGWFQGRIEWGPRALGDRSILASPLTPEMQDVVNEKIKFREPFRPFAPSVPAEFAADYVDMPPIDHDCAPEHFMLAVHYVRPEMRDVIPATTHADGTARVHAVRPEGNPLLYRLLTAFGKRTGTPVLLNTSFNLRGEPIVNTPSNALRTFFNSGMDVLVLNRHVVRKQVLL